MKMLNTNQVVFEDVTAKYPRLNQTYKFDTVENKTTPCSPLDDGAAYTLDFEMNNKDAEEFLNKIKEVYKEAAKADTKRKWKPEPTFTPYKEIDGVPHGKAKLKGAYSGEKTRPPVQKDADSNKLPEDFELTTGSKVNVWGQLFAYNTGAVFGVGLRLKGVQVKELADRVENDPFESTDGYKAADAAPAKQDAAPAKSESNGDFFDDEIPF